MMIQRNNHSTRIPPSMALTGWPRVGSSGAGPPGVRYGPGPCARSSAMVRSFAFGGLGLLPEPVLFGQCHLGERAAFSLGCSLHVLKTGGKTVVRLAECFFR